MEAKTDHQTQKEKKHLKTFSIHEKNLTIVKTFKKAILQYKHVENMLNLLIAHEFDTIHNNINNDNENKVAIKEGNKDKDYKIFNLLLNRVIMKAVLKGNPGAAKTSHEIKKINDHYQGHVKQAIEACTNLNDKNVGEIVSRLHKDWE